jgi:hypothetical protein
MNIKLIENNPATVYIFPLYEEGQAVDQWFWDAEIIIKKNHIPKHIFGSNPGCFGSLQSAFDWAYEWLNTNGYDTSNFEFEMKDASHRGIAKNEP